MAKENDEKKIKLKPYTAQNVIDARNREIKKLNKTAGKQIAEPWKPKSS